MHLPRYLSGPAARRLSRLGLLVLAAALPVGPAAATPPSAAEAPARRSLPAGRPRPARAAGAVRGAEAPAPHPAAPAVRRGVVAAGSLSTLPWPHARRLIVTSSGGDVAIRARRGVDAELSGHKTLGGTSCVASYELAGAELRVRVADSEGRPCAIDLALFVPPELSVSVTQEEGALKLSGTHGPLKVDLKRGSAVLGGLFAALEVHVDEGSASVQGLAGDGQVQLGSGNLQVFWAEAAHGTLALDLARGNATLCADAPVEVSATTPSSAHLSNTTQPPGAAPARLFVRGSVGGRLSVRSSHS